MPLDDYSAIINESAEQHGVRPELLTGLLKTESSMNPKAVGPETKYGRAQGIAQLIPDTQKRLGVADPFDPAQAIPAAAKLMRENLDRYGNEEDALRAYHGGTSKANWGKKTEAYVTKVLGNMPEKINTAYKPDGDPTWAIMQGGSLAPSQSLSTYEPTADDSTWAIMQGETIAPVQPVVPASTQIPQQPTNVLAAPQEAPSPYGEVSGTGNQFTLGVMHHVANAPLGVMQLASHILPTIVKPFSGEAATSVENFANKLDAALSKREAKYQEATTGKGLGSYVGAVFGEVANPLNRLLFSKSLTGIASPWARGAAMGGAAMAMQPVTDEESFGYGKAKQIAGGAAIGAPAERFIGPAIAKGAEWAANRMATRASTPVAAETPITPANPLEEMARLERAKDLGEIPADVADAQMMQLAEQALGRAPIAPIQQATVAPQPPIAPIQQALGRTPAAPIQQATPAPQAPITPLAQRRAEFSEVGVEPTAGQLTRDPAQYSWERNIRGKEAGAPLAERFAAQDVALSERLRELGAAQAEEAYQAGNALSRAIVRQDEPEERLVDEAYRAVRDSTGRTAQVDAASFISDAENRLKQSMLSRFLPGEVKATLRDIEKNAQEFDITSLIETDKVLSGAQRAAHARGDDQTAKAVGKVRDALNASPLAEGAPQETKALYDKARSLARQRFEKIESSPAIKAALSGVDPDTFINKFVLQGRTNDLRNLATFVKNDPESQQIVRSQIAEHLRFKGFGADVAGSKQFAPEAYNRAIRSMGREKLETFFTKKEVDKLEAIGKVGAYIHSQPSGSMVNQSGNIAALMNILDKITESVPVVGGLKRGTADVMETRRVQRALQGIPEQDLSVGSLERIQRAYSAE